MDVAAQTIPAAALTFYDRQRLLPYWRFTTPKHCTTRVRRSQVVFGSLARNTKGPGSRHHNVSEGPGTVKTTGKAYLVGGGIGSPGRQLVEIPHDVVLTVAYSVRAAQMAVYKVWILSERVPAVMRHHKSLHTPFGALINAFK